MHTSEYKNTGKSREILVRSADGINAHILVVILYYSFIRRSPWGKPGEAYTDLSMSFLIALCKSTIISIKVPSKKNNNMEDIGRGRDKTRSVSLAMN